MNAIVRTETGYAWRDADRVERYRIRLGQVPLAFGQPHLLYRRWCVTCFAAGEWVPVYDYFTLREARLRVEEMVEAGLHL